MAAFTVIFAASARADLESIAAYAAERSEAGAERVVAMVLGRARRLGGLPRAGRPRPDLGPGLRAIPVGNFLIVYRVEDRVVQVLHIAHGAPDLDRLARGWGD